MAVLVAVQITSANAAVSPATPVVANCSASAITNNTCPYLESSFTHGGTYNVIPNLAGQDCYESGRTSSTTSDRWDVVGYCTVTLPGTENYVYATDFCANAGKNMLAYERSGDTVTWHCACAADRSFVEWRTYSTSVMRRYTQTAGTNCTITGTAINEYKCAPGYYGPGNSTTGCKVCPANATCRGTPSANNSTYFTCNSGYYHNDANNGCVACPDSKVGKLGWDANGNGIKAYYSNMDIETCAIENGTRLYDNTGTFILENEDNDDCFYTK